MIEKKSFISTTVFPLKLIQNGDLIEKVKSHKIPPYHVKVVPTNRCTGTCSFCTFRERDKTVEMPYSKLISITDNLIELGTKAITITGGGDPLCYGMLPDYISYLAKRGVSIGLITGGDLLDTFPDDALNLLTWCRLSVSMEKKPLDSWIKTINSVDIDWGLSYVVVSGEDSDSLSKTIEWANSVNVKHVRVVGDILGRTPEDLFFAIQRKLRSENINLDKVVFQDVSSFYSGSKKCLSSLLLPVVDPYGRLIPCCGAVYAAGDPDLKFSNNYSMGTDIQKIYEDQNYFDGSKCVRCFQKNTNDVLNSFWECESIIHKDFI